MKKTEKKEKVVKNLELYKDYLKKYENNNWAQQIQQLAQKVEDIDKDNQTEKKEALEKKKEVLDNNKKAMGDIVDELPPEFSLICKIVDGINKDKKMNILLFPKEADKSFKGEHDLYQSAEQAIGCTYNNKHIQNALETYRDLLNSDKPFAVIYVVHHKYLFLHCEVAVHYFDKEKKTKQILATQDRDTTNFDNSFDETLYGKVIKLPEDNRTRLRYNNATELVPMNNIFSKNDQSDLIGCVVNAIKFATSALKNIEPNNNLTSPEDFNLQKDSILTFLNNIEVPKDEKTKIIDCLYDIEIILNKDNGAQEDKKKFIPWLDWMYNNPQLEYDDKTNKFKLKKLPEKLVSSGYRKYSQRNKKYLSNIGIKESKLNQIYLKDKNEKEWNVGTFLKLKTLSKKYLDVDFMDVRDNIVMALSGKQSKAKTTIPKDAALKYDDIEKKWEENDKNKQVKQKKKSKTKKNEEHDGNSKNIENLIDESIESIENNLQNSKNNIEKDSNKDIENNSKKDNNEENNLQNSKNNIEKDSNEENSKNNIEKEDKISEKEKEEKKENEDSEIIENIESIENNIQNSKKDNISNNDNNNENIQVSNGINNFNINENNQQEDTDGAYCQNIINTFVKKGAELTEFDVEKFRRQNADNHLLQHKSAIFWLNEQERRNNALLDFINNDANQSLETLNNRLQNIRGGKCSWCGGDW